METNQELIRRIAGGITTIPVTTTDEVNLAVLRSYYGDYIKGIKVIVAVGADAVVNVMEENSVDVKDKYLRHTANDNTIIQDAQVVAHRHITRFSLTSGSVMLIIE